MLNKIRDNKHIIVRSMIINQISSLLRGMNVYLEDNIISDILMYISKSKSSHHHISFLIDLSNSRILSYGFNYFFKSNTFPFSLHSEINAILKFYKKKYNTKNRKILIIFKISKSGIVGMSKPCYHCALFIRNNYKNLNLSNVYYSYRDIDDICRLKKISRKDLEEDCFKQSSGFHFRLIQSKSNHNLT